MTESAGEFPAQMRADAEICERLAVKNGFGLDGSIGSLGQVDELIDSLTPWPRASEELRAAMIRIIGAYFGEVVRKSLGGSWVQDEQFQTPALQISPSRRIFPHSSVRKRWEEGQARNLVAFVDVLTGRVKLRPWKATR